MGSFSQVTSNSVYIETSLEKPSRRSMFQVQTSRDRHKSAPYLRLKNSKRTSKCQSVFFYSTRKFFSEKISQCRKKLKKWTLWSHLLLYVTRETFLVQFPGPTGAIQNFVDRTFGRTILVTSGVSRKKADEKL